MKYLLAGTLSFLLFLPGAICIANESFTMPSSDISLGFVRGGKVARVLVTEGKTVREGNLLANLEDAAERLELERLTALAEDNSRIEAARLELAQKKTDLDRLERARNDGAVTELEVEHARLAVKQTELQVVMETFQQKLHRLNRDQLKEQLDYLRIFSPVSGKVEEVKIEPGESAEVLDPVIRVVRIDPLWIDVPIPFEEARKLKVGQGAVVSFKGASTGTGTANGKIIHVSTVADAASDTLRIRVQLENPEARPAGERVTVDFDVK